MRNAIQVPCASNALSGCEKEEGTIPKMGPVNMRLSKEKCLAVGPQSRGLSVYLIKLPLIA